MWENGGIAPASLNFKAKMDVSGQHGSAAQHRVNDYPVIVGEPQSWPGHCSEGGDSFICHESNNASPVCSLFTAFIKIWRLRFPMNIFVKN
jgi:hypothetical protein